jgi:Heterokaryon incompatibility protein (HET)
MAAVSVTPSENDERAYDYTLIRKESRDIRVLSVAPGEWVADIRCTIRTISLDCQLGYEALSYTWGDLTSTKPVFIDEVEVDITTTLERALRHLRKLDEPRTLWVDAICINQKDISEKSHQVAFMGEIYQRCSQVVIWLGCATGQLTADIDSKQEGVDPFGYWHHFAENKHLHELSGFTKATGLSEYSFKGSSSSEAVWDGFRSVAQSPWWTRLWTAQEAVLAPTAILVFGQREISLARFMEAEHNCNSHAWGCCYESLSALPADMRKLFDMSSQNVFELKQDREGISAGRFSDLHGYLLAYSHRQCTDPRDKIFGLLGMIDRAEYSTLVPDYLLDAAGTFVQAANAMLDAGRGDLKCLCGSGYGPKSKMLPSWIRDFAVSLDRDFSGTDMDRLLAYKLYDSSAARQGKFKIEKMLRLQLEGRLVDSIRTICRPVSGRKWTDTRPVLLEWLDAARLPTDLAETEASSRLDRRCGFWRTMLADILVDYDPQTHVLVRRRSTAADMKFFEDWLSWVVNDQRDLDSAVISANWTAIYGRAFFITEQDYMGLCYPTAQVGDEVWILHGGRVPFVLRPRDSESDMDRARCRTFIGDCFMDGFMDGEAVNDSLYAEEGIVLR